MNINININIIIINVIIICMVVLTLFAFQLLMSLVFNNLCLINNNVKISNVMMILSTIFNFIHNGIKYMNNINVNIIHAIISYGSERKDVII